MPTLKDSVIKIPNIGICDIDINKAVKLFDKHCFISKWKGHQHDEYKLVRNNGGRGNFHNLKVTISDKDALTLIDKLNLVEIKSATFNSGSAFYDPRFL